MTVSDAEQLVVSDAAPRPRFFDGVVCCGGGDWWYHNRGHYDMQMMRNFSRLMPILYVNSVGVRMPNFREGRMFLRRITRKLRSLGRGLRRVASNFCVFSPFALPGKFGSSVSRPMLSPQIRLAAYRAGIRRPLVWITCPPAAEVVDRLNPVAVVYQRTDRFELFPGSNRNRLRQFHNQLCQRADLTLFCSRLLFEEEGPNCRNALYVDHGVDFDEFAAAALNPAGEPEDMRSIAHPRVGFIGGIDSHTFDPPLLVDVARRLPRMQFVLVGACSLPAEWCQLPNVHLLGQRPYESVAAYMAACDVLIMPWNSGDWIKACNPVKLKEYLAVGKPVVTTEFAELTRYAGFVRRAAGGEEFADQICRALVEKPDADRLRQRVRNETWAFKSQAVLHRLAELGIKIGGST
jgi:glycosyltransferase involved in cell wall biosynthesis